MIRQRIGIGVVENQQQQVLVGRRKQGTHLQGSWEFPGGKVKSQESFKMALRRELYEELGICAHSMSKLIEFQHQYEDRHLHFQVFKISSFSGQVRSAETQQLQWVSNAKLAELDLPAANSVMLDALTMSGNYMIADQEVLSDQLFAIVEKQLRKGVSLIQYRACKDSKQAFITNAKQLKELCTQYGAKLICNCDLAWAVELPADGFHLNSRRLHEAWMQPSLYKPFELYSASCHSEEEVTMANKVGVRCILLGPVNQTQSHIDAQTMGWSRFSQLCFQSNTPVYALGGMSLNDSHNAKVHGAQGIAAIRAFRN